jgi:cell division septation protein DedD
MRIGPVAEASAAQRLKARLASEGFDAATVAEEGQIWVGHWVQLESVATREEAEKAVARLTAGGLPDVYILQTSPPFSISLGVFRDQARANKVAAVASSLGFRPQTRDRYRIGTQYWVSVVVPAGRSLPLQALGQESGQILRAEQVRC